MADKAQVLSTMNTRQKITAGVVAVVSLIIIWQVFSMFGGGKKAPPSGGMMVAHVNPPGGVQPQGTIPGPHIVQTNEVPQPQPLSPEDQATMKMQQDAQQKYLAALNQLQLLRISASIASANKDLMAAKLDTVSSEKKIVDLLSAPAEPTTSANYASSLVGPTATNNAPAQPAMQAPSPQVNYTVVSISETHDTWSAVIGNAGTLYNVRVGDVLPVDGSTVSEIHRSSVVLEKDGIRRKISLVSVI